MDERTIFLNALDLPSPESRAAYLDKICAGDTGLRERVERLLKAHEQQYGLVDRLAGNVDEPTSSLVPADQNRSEPNDDPDDLSFLGPCPSPDCIGSLGSYEILEVLGRGGMGVVLKGRDPKLQRIVAIKVLAPEIAANKMAKKRFEREAQATAAVSHDHIVTIYAVDEVKSLPFIVMECIVGRTLQKKIEETGPLELKEILRIGMQAAMGLAAAHKQGLVHRDIKPANILLQNGIQRVKITDFGLARATDDVGMTQTGQIAGTPLYMSPEQAQGQKVDHTSDLFSLGSVLYTMATGRPAFRAPSTIAVLRRVVDDMPRPIHEINEELPSWLGDIILKLMSKKKEDRFQTAAELAELLSRRLARLQEPRSSTSNNSVVAPPEKPKADPGRKSAVSSKVTSASRSPAAPRDEDELLELPERSRRVRPVRKQSMWDKLRGASPLTWLVAGVLVPGMIALVVMMAMLLNRDQLLVQIELDESLRQQDVTLVIDGTTYVARDLGPSIRVKPGSHTLEVKRGDEQFKSEQFTIFQNEKPLFRVKTEGGKLSVERADPGKEVQILAGVLSSAPAQRSWHGWPADAPKPAIAPFKADQAKKHQEEWAAYLKVPVEWRNSINMKFILIPPGEFTMGSTPEEIDAAVKAVDSNDKYWQDCIKTESPQHKVNLTQPFYLGVNEVTQAEYQTVMGVNPSYFSPTSTGKEAVAGLETGNHPVDLVIWDDAVEFCAKLSQREKLRPFYFRAGKTVTRLEGTGYRLPSEAEWEFACRAGTLTKYWIGDKDEELVKTDWIAANSGGRTHSTGELRANPFGLNDIHGNVCEWVDDGWDGAYYSEFKEMPAINPRNPFSNASSRVIRGGAWVITSSLLCRSSHRYGFPPLNSNTYYGFRISLPVDAVKSAISQDSKTDKRETAFTWPPAELVSTIGDDTGFHWGAVWSVASNQDGTSYLSSGEEGFWYLAGENEPLRHVIDPLNPAHQVLFHDELGFVTLHKNGQVQRWKLGPEPQRSVLLNVPERTRRIDISPDGNNVAVWICPHDEPYSFMDEHWGMKDWPQPDSVCTTGSVTMMKRMPDGSFAESFRLEGCRRPAISRDGKTWAVYRIDSKRLECRELTQAGCPVVAELPQEDPVTSLAYLEDGRITGLSMAGMLCLWKINGAKWDRVWETKGSGDPRWGIEVARHKPLVACFDFYGFRCVDLSSDNPEAPSATSSANGIFHEWRAYPKTAAFSGNGSRLTLGSLYGHVYRFEMAGPKVLEDKSTFRVPQVRFFIGLNRFCFSQDGSRFLCRDGSKFGHVFTWKMGGSSPTTIVNAVGNDGGGRRIHAVDREGHTAFVAFDGPEESFSVWKNMGPQPTVLNLVQYRNASAAVLSPDGLTAALGSRIGEAYLVDLSAPEPKELARITDLAGTVHNLGLSADRQRVVAVSTPLSNPKQVVVSSLTSEDGKLRETFSEQAKDIVAHDLTLDGRWLALAHSDGSVSVYEIGGESWKLHGGWKGKSPVHALSISEDGKHVCTADQSRVVRVCLTNTGLMLREWRMPGRVHATSFVGEKEQVMTYNDNMTAFILNFGK